MVRQPLKEYPKRDPNFENYPYRAPVDPYKNPYRSHDQNRPFRGFGPPRLWDLAVEGLLGIRDSGLGFRV